MERWRRAALVLWIAAMLTVGAAAVQGSMADAPAAVAEGVLAAESDSPAGGEIQTEPEYPSGVSGEATWTLVDGTMYITGQGILSGVPNADCHPWEFFEDQIRHVVVEDGITVIGDLCFAHTYNLETVTIADSVTEICQGAFRNCYELKTVKFSENLQKMGNFVFAYCEKLEKAALPDSLTKMGGSVFTGCAALTEVRLPGDLYDIQQMNFDSCMALTEVTIPAGVGFLRHASFPNCFNLKTVYFDGDQPNTNGDPFYMGSEDLVVYCWSDAKGWDEPLFYTYPVVKLDRATGLPVEERKTEKVENKETGGDKESEIPENAGDGSELQPPAGAEDAPAVAPAPSDGDEVQNPDVPVMPEVGGTAPDTKDNTGSGGDNYTEREDNIVESGEIKADTLEDSPPTPPETDPVPPDAAPVPPDAPAVSTESSGKQGAGSAVDLPAVAEDSKAADTAGTTQKDVLSGEVVPVLLGGAAAILVCCAVLRARGPKKKER